jgi:hypothetical protein
MVVGKHTWAESLCSLHLDAPVTDFWGGQSKANTRINPQMTKL